MGRIAKQKRLLMERANKSLLGEEIVIGKEYTFTDGNNKNYKGTVINKGTNRIGVKLEVPTEIGDILTDKNYEEGSIDVDLTKDGDLLVNNMDFNKEFSGGLKNQEITGYLK